MIEKINTKFEEIIVNKYGPSLKKIITKIFPDSYKINIITNMPKLKTWEKKQEKTFPIFKTRFELHNFFKIYQ
jgi:hypothetical protein